MNLTANPRKTTGIRQLGAVDIAALRAAVAEEEAHQRQQREEAEARGEPSPQFDPVSLRLRTTPFIDMLERCAKARVEVVWGV